MKKKIQLLIKYTQRYAGINKMQAAKFLLGVFNNFDFQKLSKSNQKHLVNNLLSYFENIVGGIDSFKVRNHNLTTEEILRHIFYKTEDLYYNSFYTKLF